MHCCISWVSLPNSVIGGGKNIALNILSCCRDRACPLESRNAGGFGSPTMAPEAAVRHWSWRYVPSAERNSQEKFTEYILCGHTRAVCSLGADRNRPLVAVVHWQSNNRNIVQTENWSHLLSPVEGSRCVGCRRSLTEPRTCRPKLNHSQSLSEILSASKHNRNYVCPSTAAAELRCIVTMSCLTNSNWTRESWLPACDCM